MLEDLKFMREKNKLKRIVLSYLSSQQPILTKEEQQEVNLIFKQFDKDNDGRLGKADVAMAFKEIYADESKIIEDEEMQIIIDKADTNGDGYIDIAEWQTVALSRKAMISDQQLQWAFKFFDTDGCGNITVMHFKDALKISDSEFNEEYWNQLIEQVDEDNDGAINFQEFKKMMNDDTKMSKKCTI